MTAFIIEGTARLTTAITTQPLCTDTTRHAPIGNSKPDCPRYSDVIMKCAKLSATARYSAITAMRQETHIEDIALMARPVSIGAIGSPRLPPPKGW